MITQLDGVVYHLEHQLSCVCVNKSGTLVGTAGRNVLQLFSNQPKELVAIPRTKPPTPVQLMVSNYSITDLSWCMVNESLFATSTTNGFVQLWDINRNQSFCEKVVFNQHNRTCHRVHFNPIDPNLIISGSHDGTVKILDIRSPPGNNANNYSVTFAMRNSNNNSVRDVQYRSDGQVFAAAHDDGQVLLWDTRNNNQPQTTLTCHASATLALDWHPQEMHILATAGGRDHCIKIWDLQHASSNQGGERGERLGPVNLIRTSNVTRIRWRVGKNTQLISCSNSMNDKSILLWDLKRVYIPLYTFEKHKDNVSALHWPTEGDLDTFFSAGKDGLLVRHTLREATQFKVNTMAISIGPRGDIMFASALSQLKYASKASRLPAPPPSPLGPLVSSTRITGQSPMTGGLPIALPKTPKNTISLKEKTRTYFESTPMMYVIRADHEKLFMENRSVYLALFPDAIITLANKYRLAGMSVDELCLRNAEVVEICGKPWLGSFWRLLATLFGTVSASSDPQKQNTAPAVVPTVTKDTLPTAGGQNSADLLLPVTPNVNNVSFMPTNQQGIVKESEFDTPLDDEHHRDTPKDHLLKTDHQHTGSPILMDYGATANDTRNIVGGGSVATGGGVSGGGIVTFNDDACEVMMGANDDGEFDFYRWEEEGFPKEEELSDWISGVISDWANNNEIPEESILFEHPLNTKNASNLLSNFLASMSSNPPSLLTSASPATTTNAGHDKTISGTNNSQRKMSVPMALNCGYNESTNIVDSNSTTTVGNVNVPGFIDRPNLLTTSFVDVGGDSKVQRSNVVNVTSSLGGGGGNNNAIGGGVLGGGVGGGVLKQSIGMTTNPLLMNITADQINSWINEPEDIDFFPHSLHSMNNNNSQTVNANSACLPQLSQIMSSCLCDMVDKQDELQTVVTALLVLGNRLQWAQYISIQRVASWFLDYLDILYRYGLHCAATRVINCVYKLSQSSNASESFACLSNDVASLNSNSTVRTKCGRCSKPLESACSCRKHTQPCRIVCVLCHRTVHGLMLWCQGCSHGGHMHHIQEWMKQHDQCPAGCGHRCEYE